MSAGAYISLPADLVKGGVSAAFSGELDLPELAAGPDTLRFAAPLAWDVSVVPAEGKSFLVTGAIRGVATADCARCLEPFELPLEGEVEGYLLPEDPGDALPDETSRDEVAVLDDRQGADIATFLAAALVLAAPLVPLHDEDCKGLCPECGKNLNEGPCGCAHADLADFEEAANPFAALKDYRFGN